MVEKLNLFLDLLQSYKVSVGSSCSGPASSQGCGGGRGEARAAEGKRAGAGSCRGCLGPPASPS